MPTPKLRVLIADDNDGMRTFVVGLLAMDFQVVGAVCDSDQLVKSAACLLPDVIVSDVLMPQMNGLAAREELISQGLNIPFVFVSAQGTEVVELVPKDTSVAFVYKGDMATHLRIAVEAAIAGRPFRSPLYRD